jgi:hypothetical protein
VTITYPDGEVVYFKSSSIEELPWPATPITLCKGDSVIAHEATTPPPAPPGPSVSIAVGAHSVHVGTLTGAALSTAISHALEEVCPTPTSDGAITACSTDNAYIPDIPYMPGDAETTNPPDYGDLKVTVLSSNYSSPQMLDYLIRLVGATASGSSSSNSSCKTDKWLEIQRCHPQDLACEPDEEIHEITLCNAANFAAVTHCTSNLGHADTLYALWEFEAHSGGDFICELLIDSVIALGNEIAPELAEFDGIEREELEALCQLAVDNF